jgi:hypothetical protein
MSEDDHSTILLILGMIVILGIGFVLGYITARDNWKVHAVAHGAAHWDVDVRGETAFRWNDERQP